jgi:hypothetical protein
MLCGCRSTDRPISASSSCTLKFAGCSSCTRNRLQK